MSYDIVVRFPNKQIADQWCGQMSDGFGEGFCGFRPWEQIPGTDGKKREHFRKITTETGVPVYFMDRIFGL